MKVTVLRDGRSVTMRPLERRDATALLDALHRADPMDLRRRFLGTPPPDSYLVNQLRHADGVHDLVLGAFDDTGRLVGVAQFDRPDDKPTAEVAIEVAKDWQRDGLGLALLTHLVELARSRGVHEFTATYFADNIPICRLLRAIGHVITCTYECGEGRMRLSLDEVREAS
ncbi:MAG TPA: GNAT family N-acetyltransferase [Mycobacteriales bacterium]|nr:GNAT family N-acetyltransferase [Mycobacteriales bacterium]